MPLIFACGAAAQSPPPEESPIPTGPPPKYEIPADPEALRQAAEEKAAAEAAGGDDQAVEVVQARPVGEPSSRAILAVERLGPGARPEISRQGDRLAFDRARDDGRRALYLAHADGADDRCLSCGLPELDDVNLMAPAWHPRGQLLVAVGQTVGPKSARRLGLDERQLAGPARALHSELWAISIDGRSAWELTRAGSQGSAIFDPVFSHEGGLLAWSQRQESAPAPWGKWVVEVGELKIGGGVPRLGKVETFDPSPFGRFVQVAGFTPDDHGLLLIVQREDGRPAAGRYDLRAKTFELLGKDEDTVVQVAELPQGEGTLWITRGEIWLVSPSGRGRERLTSFNEPSSRYFLGRAEPLELAVAPDGKSVVVDLFEARPGAPPRQNLYRLRFDPTRLGPGR